MSTDPYFTNQVKALIRDQNIEISDAVELDYLVYNCRLCMAERPLSDTRVLSRACEFMFCFLLQHRVFSEITKEQQVSVSKLLMCAIVFPFYILENNRFVRKNLGPKTMDYEACMRVAELSCDSIVVGSLEVDDALISNLVAIRGRCGSMVDGKKTWSMSNLHILEKAVNESVPLSLFVNSVTPYWNDTDDLRPPTASAVFRFLLKMCVGTVFYKLLGIPEKDRKLGKSMICTLAMVLQTVVLLRVTRGYREKIRNSIMGYMIELWNDPWNLDNRTIWSLDW